MKYAHYISGKYPSLIITDSMQPIGGTVYKVTGKRDARTLAASMNAKPWNF